MIALSFGVLIACSAVLALPAPSPRAMPGPAPAAYPQPVPQPLPQPQPQPYAAPAPAPSYLGGYGGLGYGGLGYGYGGYGIGYGVEELVVEAPYGPYEQFIGGPVYPEVFEEFVGYPGYGYPGIFGAGYY